MIVGPVSIDSLYSYNESDLNEDINKLLLELSLIDLDLESLDESFYSLNEGGVFEKISNKFKELFKKIKDFIVKITNKILGKFKGLNREDNVKINDRVSLFLHYGRINKLFKYPYVAYDTDNDFPLDSETGWIDIISSFSIYFDKSVINDKIKLERTIQDAKDNIIKKFEIYRGEKFGVDYISLDEDINDYIIRAFTEDNNINPKDTLITQDIVEKCTDILSVQDTRQSVIKVHAERCKRSFDLAMVQTKTLKSTTFIKNYNDFAPDDTEYLLSSMKVYINTVFETVKKLSMEHAYVFAEKLRIMTEELNQAVKITNKAYEIVTGEKVEENKQEA